MTTKIQTTSRINLTGCSDPSWIGNTVLMYGDGIQATIQSEQGAPIVQWTRDIRFGEVTVMEKKTPGWAIFLGIVGIFFFLIGIIFFFIKTDHPVVKSTVTVYNNKNEWATGTILAVF